MEKWRGTVVQLTVLAIIGALAWREPKYIEHAFMLLGAVLGANVTGAKVSAAFAAMMGGGDGSGRSPPAASMPPRSMSPPGGVTKITGLVLGALGFDVLFRILIG